MLKQNFKKADGLGIRLVSREGDGGGFKDIEFLEQLCFYLGNFRATRFYLNLVVSAFLLSLKRHKTSRMEEKEQKDRISSICTLRSVNDGTEGIT